MVLSIARTKIRAKRAIVAASLTTRVVGLAAADDAVGDGSF
jgi:hypothetical protein